MWVSKTGTNHGLSGWVVTLNETEEAMIDAIVQASLAYTLLAALSASSVSSDMSLATKARTYRATE